MKTHDTNSTQSPLADQFRQIWPCATADSNLTLHGFRRFKTTHLVNLRFLENEIAQLDRNIYQAGLSLNIAPSSTDRLGLRNVQKDPHFPPVNEAITESSVSRLRILLKEYDEALISFNTIMKMETMSLLDDDQQSSARPDLSLSEKYETRLLRVDLGPRSRTDPFQRWVHKQLRKFRFWSLSRNKSQDAEVQRRLPHEQGHSPNWSHQNTLLLTNIIGRLTAAIIAGAFLVVLLALLSVSVRGIQFIVVSVCILLFSIIIGIVLSVSNYEMLVASAAYAAVLVVFISNQGN